jgi:nitroimidazol reductase NimA-like FMN-containing flavoprotein (pyridoxamine 5'-phosphate oxidase superfamily)
MQVTEQKSYWKVLVTGQCKLLNRKVTGKYKLLDSANYWTVKVTGQKKILDSTSSWHDKLLDMTI